MLNIILVNVFSIQYIKYYARSNHTLNTTSKQARKIRKNCHRIQLVQQHAAISVGTECRSTVRSGVCFLPDLIKLPNAAYQLDLVFL